MSYSLYSAMMHSEWGFPLLFALMSIIFVSGQCTSMAPSNLQEVASPV